MVLSVTFQNTETIHGSSETLSFAPLSLRGNVIVPWGQSPQRTVVETLSLGCTDYFLELSLLTAFSKGSSCPVQSEPGNALALEGMKHRLPHKKVWSGPGALYYLEKISTPLKSISCWSFRMAESGFWSATPLTIMDPSGNARSPDDQLVQLSSALDTGLEAGPLTWSLPTRAHFTFYCLRSLWGRVWTLCVSLSLLHRLLAPSQLSSQEACGTFW